MKKGLHVIRAPLPEVSPGPVRSPLTDLDYTWELPPVWNDFVVRNRRSSHVGMMRTNGTEWLEIHGPLTRESVEALFAWGTSEAWP